MPLGILSKKDGRMTIETWLTFVVAYFVVSAIPGPSVLMVVSQSLSKGLGPATLCIIGDIVGGMAVMALSYMGLGAILAASNELFQVVKWCGVAYMAYLGWSSINDARKQGASLEEAVRSAPKAKSLSAGFFTGLLNPKAIVFYMAFLSQFIDISQPHFPQFLVLMISASVIVFAVLGAYAVLATKARYLFQRPSSRKMMGYAGGSMLLGGSAWIAVTR